MMLNIKKPIFAVKNVYPFKIPHFINNYTDNDFMMAVIFETLCQLNYLSSY